MLYPVSARSILLAHFLAYSPRVGKLADNNPAKGAEHVLATPSRSRRVTAPSFLSLATARRSEDTRMTWGGLVWKNLRRRRVRTALTSAGVAIGVGLIVALLSIAAGVRRTANDLSVHEIDDRKDLHRCFDSRPPRLALLAEGRQDQSLTSDP